MGKAGQITIQNLIKIEISKMTVRHDTLVDDSCPLPNFVLFFSLACFMFVFDQTLVGHLYCDKGLL